ncbi:MAG: ester cyclase [Chloroflexota bacterium]|nr:ester cyclase [Chloroflexota bacterium]
MNIHSHSHVIVCAFKTHLAVIISALLLSASPVAAAPADAPVMSVQFFDAVLGEYDLDVAATIVSADALLHTPDGVFVGYDGAGQFAASLRDSFSNVTFVTQEPSLAGDLATVQWTMTGVHSGEYQGLEPAGASVSLHGLAVLRFNDRVIVEQWIEYDRLSLVNQIQAFALIGSCDAECLKPTGNR